MLWYYVYKYAHQCLIQISRFVSGSLVRTEVPQLPSSAYSFRHILDKVIIQVGYIYIIAININMVITSVIKYIMMGAYVFRNHILHNIITIYIAELTYQPVHLYLLNDNNQLFPMILLLKFKFLLYSRYNIISRCNMIMRCSIAVNNVINQRPFYYY